MAKQRKIAVVDCETDPFNRARYAPHEIQPFIWGYYDGEIYEQFYDTEKFIEFLKEQDVICFAHNGGKFDWIFPCVIKHVDLYFPPLLVSGRLSRAKIGKCEIRDSYNLLPVSLSKMQKDVFDYEKMHKENREKAETKKEIEVYLKHDCEYLFNYVSKFIDSYGSKITLPGNAFEQWKKISGQKAPDNKNGKIVFDEISPYYYGGRVECFYEGIINKPFKVIDINSAYPFAMKSEFHPYGKIKSITDKLPQNRNSIGRCFITTAAESKGFWPYREKEGLCFPNDGKIRTFNITGWEYLCGLDLGLKNVKVEKVIEFDDTINFSDYVDHFYEMKVEAKRTDNKAEYLFSKLFLTSLSGKFAQNPNEFKNYMFDYTANISDLTEIDEKTGLSEYQLCEYWGDIALFQKEVDDVDKRFYHMAVSASITGFVRAYLMRAMAKCGGLLYCDTDSIACESFGSLPIDSERLGAWDIEGDCVSGGIAGKKLYCFKMKDGKYKTASKGVRLKPHDILRIAKGQELTYISESPCFSIKSAPRYIDRKVKKTTKIAKRKKLA